MLINNKKIINISQVPKTSVIFFNRYDKSIIGLCISPHWYFLAPFAKISSKYMSCYFKLFTHCSSSELMQLQYFLERY